MGIPVSHIGEKYDYFYGTQTMEVVQVIEYDYLYGTCTTERVEGKAIEDLEEEETESQKEREEMEGTIYTIEVMKREENERLIERAEVEWKIEREAREKIKYQKDKEQYVDHEENEEEDLDDMLEQIDENEEQEVGGWFSMADWDQDIHEREEEWEEEEEELARTGAVFWRSDLEMVYLTSVDDLLYSTWGGLKVKEEV